MKKATDNGRGRPRFFGQNMNRSDNLFKALQAIGTENHPSVYLLKQIQEAGFVKAVPIKKETRGRPAFKWQFTKRAMKFVSAVQLHLDKKQEEEKRINALATAFTC